MAHHTFDRIDASKSGIYAIFYLTIKYVCDYILMFYESVLSKALTLSYFMIFNTIIYNAIQEW